MKKIITTVATSLVLMSGLSAEAVLLPHSMRVYLFNNVVGTSIRFDGLINLPDGTMYVPVIPAQQKEVETLAPVWTYPSGLSLKNKPDIIVFNNDYALLKVIKDGRKCTVSAYENLPDVIKTGILPQDMLVPNGFYVSENMKGLLGNLEVPVFEKTIKTTKKELQAPAEIGVPQVVAKKNGKKIIKTRKKVLKTNMPQELSNKMYLVTNFDSQYLKVFVPGRPEPIYGLKLKGVLKDVKVTPDKRYIVAAVFGKNEVDIADISNEQIAKSIDIGMQPSEVAVDKNSNKAYVLSNEGKSIFAINLNDMTINEKVTLEAAPYRMTLSPNGSQIAYADKNTDGIYILKTDDEYKNVPVTKCKNISKMILDDNGRLYALSRTENALYVNDYNLNKPYIIAEEEEDQGVVLQKKLAANTRKFLGGLDINANEKITNTDIEPTSKNNATVQEFKIQVGNKPTEMFLYDRKLFVLCSGDNVISVLDTDTLKEIDKISIPFNGFARKITRVDDTSLALVTDTAAKKYAIINLDTNKIVGTYPLDMPIYSITIIDKINNINLLEQSL